jgi:adenylate kinase
LTKSKARTHLANVISRTSLACPKLYYSETLTHERPNPVTSRRARKYAACEVCACHGVNLFEFLINKMSARDKYKVIYLTGAPATGKSTLSSYISEHLSDVVVLSYSKLLSSHLAAKHQSEFDKTQMRSQSSQVITYEDIKEVDEVLIRSISNYRTANNILIDSHAVTKESYGYRATPFSADLLKKMSPTDIVVLYASPDVIIKRINKDPQGRPFVSVFEADYHNQLQSSVAISYSINLGIQVNFLNSDKPLDELLNWFIKKFNNHTI